MGGEFFPEYTAPAIGLDEIEPLGPDDHALLARGQKHAHALVALRAR
jgi:hypothetical protein